MHPILIKLGPLTLRWYGLLIAIGFLVAYRLFRKRAARLGLDESEAANLMLLLFTGGILGARIYYVIWKWNVHFGDEPSFAENPLEILMIHRGGLVFFGGLLMASVFLGLWARWKGRSMAVLADALAPSAAVGHMFGRLGCFMNGCCHGRECNLPWAIRLNSPPEVAGIPVHPTQLYEFLGLLEILVALIVIEKISRYPGQVVLSYFMLYSILRFIVEFFRGDVSHHIFGHFTLAQMICVMIFLASWLLSARLSYRAMKARGAGKF